MYTFTPNTVAESAKVNANFEGLADGSEIADEAILPRHVSASLGAGWLPLGDVPDTITYNGNRSYDLVFNSNDLTDTLSNGMKLKLTRTVSAPTYMGGLFNGSSHYFTKVTCTSTLSTVTNSFTLMAHVEPTAYQASFICGRSDATPANGLWLEVNSSGQVICGVRNGGSSNYRYVNTYQSLTLNKKTHVAASWSSGTVEIYFDGKSVPVATATTSGTAPTTAGTGGDFSVGRMGAYAGQYFAGYISGVGVFNAVLSAATIRSYASQALLGSETNCIGAWSLNNTGVNQQSAGTNDLTATGGVSYTVRSTYGNYLGGTLEYAIITANSFSTNTTLTVQVPEGCAIPTSGGVSAVAYSTNDTPYGLPRDKNRWHLISHYRVNVGQASPTANTFYNINNQHLITAPVGAFEIVSCLAIYVTRASGITKHYMTIATTAGNTEDNRLYTAEAESSPGTDSSHTLLATREVNNSSQTAYYANYATTGSSVVGLYVLGASSSCYIKAKFQYV